MAKTRRFCRFPAKIDPDDWYWDKADFYMDEDGVLTVELRVVADTHGRERGVFP